VKVTRMLIDVMDIGDQICNISDDYEPNSV